MFSLGLIIIVCFTFKNIFFTNIGNIYFKYSTICIHTKFLWEPCLGKAQRAETIYQTLTNNQQNAVYTCFLLSLEDPNRKCPTFDKSGAIQYSAIIAKRHLMLANRFIQMGKFIQAEMVFKETIDIFPNESQLYIAFGDFLLGQKDYAEALWLYDRAISRIPSMRAVWYFRQGVNYFYQAQYSLALGMFKKADHENLLAPSLSYSEPIQLHYYSAVAYESLSDTQSAAGEFQLVIQNDPQHKWSWPTYAAYLGLSRFKLQSGELEEAMELTRQAMKITDSDDQKAEVFHQSGKINLAMNHLEQALIDLTAAAHLNSSNIWILISLGDCYNSLGRVSEARDAYAGALKLDPKNSYASEQIKKLSGP